VALILVACKPTPPHGPSEQAATAGGDPQHLEKKFFIPAGKFAEVNVQMSAGEEATADYIVEEGGTIEWNVHSHPTAKDTVVHDEGEGPKGGMTFRAPSDGAYSFLWENKKGKRSVMVRVKLSLSGSARVTSWVPSP